MTRLVFALSFLISGQAAWSCNCFTQPTFCATIDTSWYEPDIIVLATKVSDIHYGMQLVVDQTFIGGTEVGDTLMVWGDNGALCRIYPSTWNIGQTAVFALHFTDFSGNWITNPQYPPHLEQPGDYHISVCGVYSLGYSNGMVTGPIAPGFTSMSLNDFAAIVDDCSVTTRVNEVEPELDFVVWSDGEQLIVELPTDVRNGFEMTLVNTEGRTLRYDRLIPGRNVISVGRMAKGMYLVQVHSRSGQGVKKVLFR